ncbi:imidazole glycerol phosphate synthase cyclase subunit [Bdellovibrio bacteriovorus]|uniref:imidazole glycerol-phosphate synthase n=1 Tax=Bdellovibrio bacteriovorus TaxID=959 RepID=A0A162G2P9_BDEBC|nr:imidazole glycerol phosphate synthase cyclase subunit [Bdellovibrio bacteriovorus]KYG64170.1 imidazole glycerol phosphate synthase cyclase subunit [Bdellovibrio bacteriovorus]
MEKQRYIRLIPRLDIKGPNLVKGIHLEGLRVLGDPDVFARQYYEAGADELFYMDVVASLYERNSLTDMVSRIANDVFIPITVGGGLRSLDDIKKVLDSGADKISLNTAAIRNPSLVEKAAHRFGSSTIVISVEAIKQPDGRYLAFIDNGREDTGVEVMEWVKRVENLGAGELVITSVDKEGTGEGFDIDLIKSVCSLVKVPVVAHGGAGSVADIVRVVKETTANGIAVGSIFHYDVVSKHNTVNSEKAEGNTRFLSENRSYGKIKPVSFKEVSEALKTMGVVCRAL